MTCNQDDYGHTSSCTGGMFIDQWGAGSFLLKDGDKTWSFEFSSRFGPLLLDSKGGPKTIQPTSPRNPFWKPFNAWLSQGKQVEKGVAIWRKPLPMVLRQIAGRHYKIEENGEDGGEIMRKPMKGTGL
jgi:hypothetical protein